MLSRHTLTRPVFVLTLLLALGFFCVSGSYALPKSSVILSQDKELIIQIEGMNEKNIALIRKSIEANDGVLFRGICHSNHVLMYVVDRDVQTDNSFVDAALAPLNLTYFVKDGATITQVQSQCSDSSSDNTNTTE